MRYVAGLICAVLLCESGVFGVSSDFPSGPFPVKISSQEREIRNNPIESSPEPDDPPVGDIVSYPEWAPAESVMIGWMWFNSYFIELTREFQNAAQVQIVVESATQESTVRSMLGSAGVPLDNIRFFRFPLDTCWIVDYGPFFIGVNDQREIVDQMYPGRPDDDAFPQRLAESWMIPSHASDLRIEGGNFFPDGHGICFTTTYLFEQNAGYLTEQQVRDRMQDYCGCETLHVLEPLDDYTGHIDMFAKLINDHTMLIGQYQPDDPEYQKLEDNAELVESLMSSTGEPFTVVRIPMPGEPSLYWTYTNGLILNDYVFVPTYDLPGDVEAILIHEALFPQSTVVGINALEPIEYGGAIHCTSKAIASESIPTSTPVLTATPYSTPSTTPTPVNTATPNPSSTITMTPTPTAPSATPTAPSATWTPAPSSTPTCGNMGVSISMSAHHFESGDPCRCDVMICNPSAQTYSSSPVFVILDVYGSLFFAPGFGTFDHYTKDVVPGISTISVIPEFQWPSGTGIAQGIKWYAGMTDPEMTELIGHYSEWEFSWAD